MPTQQLLDYIRQNLAAGLVRADIEKALLAAGWQTPAIAAAFAAINTPISAPAPLAAMSNDNALETARIQKELELEAAKRHP